MNRSTPNFVSQVAASSQTISSIEEHNSAKSAVHLHPISGTHGLSSVPGVPSSPPTLTPRAELTPNVVDALPITDPSTLPSAADPGIANNVGPFIDIPSGLKDDTKGLASALEASNVNAPLSQTESLRGAAANAAMTDIGRALVTAEALGHVSNLARWIEEKLGSSVVSRWGVAEGTKPVANLWNELAEGESSLEDGRPPRRTVNVARVKIINDEGNVLVETCQEMSDGSRRRRNCLLAEKMKSGEDVEDACRRGILEELGSELGANERVSLLPKSYVKEEEERDSIAYPGLSTRYVIHSMEAYIQDLPVKDFSTDEGEDNHGGEGSTTSGDAGEQQQQLPRRTVKRHHWSWMSQNELTELCTRETN